MSTAVSIILAILAFGVLIASHEFGHFITAKLFKVQVNEFALGMGPKLISFTKGETAYSLRLLPLGGFCAMEGEDEECDNPRAFTSASAWKRFIILIAGAAMNLIIGFIMLIILLAPSKYTTQPIISDLADQYTETGLGGMQEGDRIISINGERVWLAQDIGTLLGRYSSPYDIVVERDGEKIELEDAVLEVKELSFDGEAFTGYGLRYSVVESTFWLNLKEAFCWGIDYVRLIRFSLADLIKGAVSVKDLSGPVGITSVMSETATSAGFSSFVNLVAFISINLAVMNLLPLPALDGGRVFFVLLGALARLCRIKPIPYKYEGYVHLAGLVIFMLFFVFVTYQDIARLIS